MTRADQPPRLTAPALELRLCGLQRGGSRAIPAWIAEQFADRRTCALFNVRHGSFNPYETAARTCSFHMGGRAPDAWSAADKDVLVYSYEDCAQRLPPDAESLLASVFAPSFQVRREEFLGASRKTLDLLILREPAAFFASRVRAMDRITGITDLTRVARFWKELAHAALDIERYHRQDIVVVLYDRWRHERTYRQSLARRIGGTFSDGSMRQGPEPEEAGSRWRNLLRPGQYLGRGPEVQRRTRVRELLGDRELQELRRAVFGEPTARSLSSAG